MLSYTKVGIMIRSLLFISYILLCNAFGIHRCVQGHKCVYYRGGKLLEEINDPGFHLKIPFISSHYNI